MTQETTVEKKHDRAAIVKDEKGATILEYIVLACLVVGAAFAIIGSLGSDTNDKFKAADDSVKSMTFGTAAP